MKHLLDTCVVSEPLRARPDARVMAWLRECDEREVCLSVLTLGEIQRGAARLAPGRRRRSIERWLERDLCERFAERILSVDQQVAFAWGTLVAQGEQCGRPVPSVDGLIAATALVHRLTVVTRDDSFGPMSVETLNPWTGG